MHLFLVWAAANGTASDTPGVLVLGIYCLAAVINAAPAIVLIIAAFRVRRPVVGLLAAGVPLAVILVLADGQMAEDMVSVVAAEIALGAVAGALLDRCRPRTFRALTVVSTAISAATLVLLVFIFASGAV